AVAKDNDLADGLARGRGTADYQGERGASAATLYIGEVHCAVVPTRDDGNYGLESAVATCTRTAFCVLLYEAFYLAAAIGAMAASAW
ncbi:MAG: hypothetical protein WBD33_19700, partial [Xanthobacteraceae bacterium]